MDITLAMIVGNILLLVILIALIIVFTFPRKNIGTDSTENLTNIKSQINGGRVSKLSLPAKNKKKISN